MKTSAFAKVNLTLEVLGKRPDGFHELRSVVRAVTLADDLDVEATDDASVVSDTGYGDADLAVRAAKALRESVGPGAARLGARMRVVKRIPAGGGLGGGSADAAAALLALNKLWNAGKSPEELAAVGASVGSDVPALVLAHAYRSPVLMEGRGERVSVLPPDGDARTLVLVHPGVASSTAEVYARCVPRTEPADGAVNDLQAPACSLHPEIATALAALVAAGAEDVMMSGSGSVVYGFAQNPADAESVAERMRAVGCRAWTSAFLR